MFPLALALSLTAAHADEAPKAAAVVGQPAPVFALNDLDGHEVKLSDLQGKTVVLEWFNPGCPFVKYAHGDGPLADMAVKHSDADTVWLAINSSAPGKQGHGVALNREATATWNLEHPVLLDEGGTVGRLYGAKTTPQMFVVDPAGVLVYAGALDNAPLGKPKGDFVNYVAAALTSLDAGEAIARPDVPPYGCSVKY